MKPLTWRIAWNVLKDSVTLFRSDDTGTLGAALSYFTLFSLAPVIIIVIALSGLVLGPTAVAGDISGHLQSLLGAKGANLIQEIIKAAYRPGKNVFAAIAAVAMLMIGSVGVFTQLRTSLNTLWKVKGQPKKPVIQFFLGHLFSFAMIITLAFLLLISLVIHAGLDVLTLYFQHRFYYISIITFELLNHVFSLGLTWLLFALIYKFMSDAKLKWRTVWWGALFTAFLFAIGKFIMELYLGWSNVGDTYGAAGSVIVILVWIFYSSQILLFGAEFTWILAKYRGDHLQ
jgi:membrane protein